MGTVVILPKKLRGCVPLLYVGYCSSDLWVVLRVYGTKIVQIRHFRYRWTLWALKRSSGFVWVLGNLDSRTAGETSCATVQFLQESAQGVPRNPAHSFLWCWSRGTCPDRSHGSNRSHGWCLRRWWRWWRWWRRRRRRRKARRRSWQRSGERRVHGRARIGRR